MVLAAALSGTALAAGCESGPLPERPAGPLATMPGGSVASPPAVTGMPAAARCLAALYGPQRYAPGSGKTVALTFDDGPGRSTTAILAVLLRYTVPATFFNIGVSMAPGRRWRGRRPGTGTCWATTAGITRTWCCCPRRGRTPNWTGPEPSSGP